ncbi:hypothetical protein BDZ45DRAFT_737899 [Acephala macrosclerotiorum]|nr:hypothetical protein BDZ45DRAFT_737899 [Acephala macrosclerotiorum]
MASQRCGEQHCKFCQETPVVVDDGTGIKADDASKSAKCYWKSILYICGHRLDLPFIKHSQFANCKDAKCDVCCGNIASQPIIYNYHGRCHVCFRDGEVESKEAEDQEMGEDASLEKLVEDMNLG